MATVIVYAFESSGDPLSGLTLSWHSYTDASTGTDIEPQPSITDIGDGAYVTEVSEGACGNVDCTSAALQRYVPVQSTDGFTFPAYSATTAAPQAGKTPTWDLYADNAGNDLSDEAPTLSALTKGWYRAAFTPTAAAARIDLGSGTSPRYLTLTQGGTVAGGDDSVRPVVSSVTPSPGTPISRSSSIVINVTDETSLGRVLVLAKLMNNGRPLWEVVHDGNSFGPEYATASVRQTISGGVKFTVSRRGGWPSAPVLQTFAMDASGNENE